VLEARVAASQGRFQAAVELLTELLDHEEPLPEWQRLVALSSRGTCHAACGRWQEADADHVVALEGWDRVGNKEGVAEASQALQIYRDLRQPVNALQAALHLAEAAASHGAWSEATEAATHAAEYGKALDKLDRWSPSSRQKNADRANSLGARALTDPSVGICIPAHSRL
jgi:hypothetical protein